MSTEAINKVNNAQERLDNAMLRLKQLVNEHNSSLTTERTLRVQVAQELDDQIERLKNVISNNQKTEG